MIDKKFAGICHRPNNMPVGFQVVFGAFSEYFFGRRKKSAQRDEFIFVVFGEVFGQNTTKRV